MSPVVSALFAFVVSLFRSHASLRLLVLAHDRRRVVYFFRTHVSLAMDCPDPRPVDLPPVAR
jgi:hypothetical protein